jgi:hypothetical protein
MNDPNANPLRDREIDQVLAADAEIVPSPGFKLRVMAAVRSEAAAPPLPFPWAIALPGPILSITALVWVVLGTAGPSAPVAVPPTSILSKALTVASGVAHWAHLYAVDWLLLASSLAWMSWKLSVRLAGMRS